MKYLIVVGTFIRIHFVTEAGVIKVLFHGMKSSH